MSTFSTEASRMNLLHQHSHRTPDADAQRLLRDIRQRFLDLAIFVDDRLPPTRERSLVMTKLEEARQWACNAAVAEGVIREELTINRP